MTTSRDPLGLKAWLGDGRARICPSLLNCDFSRLAEEIDSARAAGAEAVHWDVMDGHFVPNLSYGAMLIDSMRPHKQVVFDAHLMMSEPERYLDDFLRAGCDTITFHVEAVPDPRHLVERIRAAGALAGIALNPPTPVETLAPFLDGVDLVLVMSVPPGFGGQPFDRTALDKLRWLKDRVPPGTLLEVDGGVNRATIGEAARAGAGMLVVGSAFFRAPDRLEEFRSLTHLANLESLEGR